MSSIDERVVQMKFQNAAFEQGVLKTLSTLERLNKALQLQEATKGLSNIGTVANQQSTHFQKLEMGVQTLSTKFKSGFESAKTSVSNVTQTLSGLGQKASDGLGRIGSSATQQSNSLKNLEGGVSTLASRFSTLGTVAAGALMSIGARAQEAGTQLLNSFTFAPIMDGFREYETNLNSIQTILANTQAAGTNLKDVTGALEELNHYSDQTIYNFSEMAKNIGTFTAAGVDLETSTAAIKGIANLAALSGSNSEQASGAMYQLSQAISAGRVSLEDWNSVVNAGMGGTVFQRALAQNAEKMGTLGKGAVDLKGKMKNVTIEGKSFRESITAKPGEESWLTSEVLTRTLSQFTGDLSDAELAAQGFSKAQIKAIQDQAKMAKSAATEVKTATQLFGTFKEQLGSGWAKTWEIIFGDFTEAKGLFTGIADGIGGMLQGSADARNKMLSDWDKLGGRTALIEGVTNVFKALVSVAKPIKDAFREMFPATTGKQLAEMTKNFRDFTEKLKVGGETADKIKRTFAGVFAIFGIAVDIIKEVVGTIFDLVGVATKGSGGFLNFTAKIGDFLVALRNGIREGEGLKNFFKGLGTVLAIPIKLVQKLAGFLGSLFKDTDSKGVEKSVEGISSKLEPLGRLGDVVSKVWEKTLTVMRNVGDFFKNLGSDISKVFSNMGIDLASTFEGFDFDTLFAGLNTGVLAGLFVIIKRFLGTFGGGAGGIFEAISDGIGDLTGSFSAMQNTLKAATLLQIALAIGVLSVSLSILSKINPDDLKKAGAAITVLFAQLLGSMAIFQKFIGFTGFAKMPFVMGSLILLAGAVLILAQAVKQLSSLNWNELAKGLTGLAVTLGLLVASLKLMPNPSGLISTGLGLIVLAAAIKILASAVEDLSSLGWNELAKGLVGVGTLLGALTLFTMFSKVSKGGILQGAGLLLLAVGIKVLASAVADLSGLSWNEMAKGLLALGGALAIVTGALMLIPPTAPLAALGVLGVAISLGMVAKALEQMAVMSWAEIGSSLTVMLGTLAIIAAALILIPPTAPLAAAGVLIVALALEQVAVVLARFAAYSWEEIALSMTMLAGTMGIITAAMLLMTTALPGALATIVIAGALAILAPVLMQFSQMSLTEIGTALLMLAGVFAVFAVAAILLTPVIPLMFALGAAVALLGVGMLAAGAGMFLFATGLTALAAAGAAGTAAIIGIVTGLIGLIPTVMKQIGLGLIAFAKVIATAGPAITKALVTVLNSLLKAVSTMAPKIVSVLLKMLLMMIQAMARYVPQMVSAGMKMIVGILTGIANNIGKIIAVAAKVVVNFLNGISKALPKIIQAGVNMIIKFVESVAKSIEKNSERMGRAGGKLAVAIVKGMVKGIKAGAGEIIGAAKDMAGAALDGAKDFLGINSPSKEFEKIGKFVNDGFRKGLDGNKKQVSDAFNSLKSQLSNMIKSSSKEVDQLEAKLKHVRNSKDRSRIKKDLAQARKEEARSKSAYTYLKYQLDDEALRLGKLANVYDKLSEKIKKQQEVYDNAKKTRDDYNKSVREQYSDQATPTADISVADYTTNLEKQIEDTKVYSNTLQRLRKMGLNDELYKDLIAAGPSALPFAESLLAAGPEAVSKLKSLAGQLNAAGSALGKDASTNLYQAGVNSAKGILDGLKKAQKGIEKQMDKIADMMVKAIKKKLKIKSPSVVFAQVGSWTGEGLAKGLDSSSNMIKKSSENMGQTAMDSIRKSLTNVADMISGSVDGNPVITPVLDLSSVKKDAGLITDILGSDPKAPAMSIDSAYAKAKYVASSYARSQTDSASSNQGVSKSVSYVQNNYSPKSISTAEVYRNTKNQLSTAKGALST